MRVAPTQVILFLQARGWTPSSINAFPKLRVFTHSVIEGRQLFLPTDETAPDYDDAIQSLLTKLAFIEGKDLRMLSNQLERTEVKFASDVQDGMALRVLKTVSGDESIPLLLAHAVIRDTETILMSGSCTAEKPRHFFRRLDNKISNEIRERAVFNHTRRGSFILSVSCPIAGPGEQLGLGLSPDEWTKSRRAFVAVYRGIRSLTDGISRDEGHGLVEELLSTESPLVSANFCEAVADLASNISAEGMTIGFEWSRYVPLPPDIDDKKELFVTPSMSDSLYRISEALRPKELPVEDVFIGTVEALRGDITKTGERAGSVEFSLLLKDGLSIRASGILTPEQYKLADEAHIGGARYISISGKLVPHPRVWTFELIRSFTLIDN